MITKMDGSKIKTHLNATHRKPPPLPLWETYCDYVNRLSENSLIRLSLRIDEHQSADDVRKDEVHYVRILNGLNPYPKVRDDAWERDMNISQITWDKWLAHRDNNDERYMLDLFLRTRGRGAYFDKNSVPNPKKVVNEWNAIVRRRHRRVILKLLGRLGK